MQKRKRTNSHPFILPCAVGLTLVLIAIGLSGPPQASASIGLGSQRTSQAGAASLLGSQMLSLPSDPSSSFYAYASGVGIRWARVYLYWNSVQASPTSWDWGGYDQILANLKAIGITPIVTLAGNPCWASSYGCPASPNYNGGEGPIDQVGGLAGFQSFITALVNRYKGTVNYYELYNEPDDNGRWGSGVKQLIESPNYTAPGPIAYAQMLEIAAPGAPCC